MDDIGIEEFLCNVFVCPPAVAGHILARGHLRNYPRQTTITRRGEALSSTFLLIFGHARALLYTAEGQIILLHEYRRGDLFGALGEQRAAEQDSDVLAVDDVRALAIEAAHLVLLAEQHGCIGLALSRLLTARLRQASARLYERAALSSIGRVHAELLRQARQSEALTITPAPVLADLALIAATTRETASRAVNALERRGIIRRDGDALIVVAPHRLEEMIL